MIQTPCKTWPQTTSPAPPAKPHMVPSLQSKWITHRFLSSSFPCPQTVFLIDIHSSLNVHLKGVVDLQASPDYPHSHWFWCPPWHLSITFIPQGKHFITLHYNCWLACLFFPLEYSLLKSKKKKYFFGLCVPPNCPSVKMKEGTTYSIMQNEVGAVIFCIRQQ